MDKQEQFFDVVIIGAGAAGMMCAIEAGKRGRSVILIDHYKKIGEKIRISGGGRCNFTNVFSGPDAFLSNNRHFCKSALKQYTQHDFITLMNKHNIAFHEKKLGQLFCDDTAQQIIDMLKAECHENGASFQIETTVLNINKSDNGYAIETDKILFQAQSLVIATGGLSIPKIGATKFGYEVARQFGLNVIDTRAALVPLTFQAALLDKCKLLSGLSVEASVTCGKITFAEGLLFTHRGLSGPSILQISSYWQEGQEIVINLAPEIDAYKFFKEYKNFYPKKDIQTVVGDVVPNRLAISICEELKIKGKIAEISDKVLLKLSEAINVWRIKPSGHEGYRTAEVTLGGVDTNELSSKTMEAHKHPGLYFIGEVLDVTGWLGGYNFQWAWSSGYAAGQNV